MSKHVHLWGGAHLGYSRLRPEARGTIHVRAFHRQINLVGRGGWIPPSVRWGKRGRYWTVGNLGTVVYFPKEAS